MPLGNLDAFLGDYKNCWWQKQVRMLQPTTFDFVLYLLDFGVHVSSLKCCIVFNNKFVVVFNM